MAAALAGRTLGGCWSPFCVLAFGLSRCRCGRCDWIQRTSAFDAKFSSFLNPKKRFRVGSFCVKGRWLEREGRGF